MSQKEFAISNIRENIRSPKIWLRVIILVMTNYTFSKYSAQILEIIQTPKLVFVLVNISWVTFTLYSNKPIQIVDSLVNKILYSVQTPTNIKLFMFCKFIYSAKTQKEVFEPIVADWQEEYFEALFKKEIWKARWINVRYTYAFLAAMWQKSPIGDLIEFVIKIAKQ